VSAGAAHTCALRTDKTLWCFGLNNSGRLGDGTTTTRLAPVQVGTATTWTKVSAGGSHTCALQGAALSCWGSNTNGQIGDGTTTVRLTPTAVGSGAFWTDIATGSAHTIGLQLVL
jgi:alpha-tubulin suppressor-like RCC1 family protein